MRTQFRYVGMASTGKTVQGVIEADSEAEAFAQLRDEGLIVQRCTPIRGAQQDASPLGETHEKHSAARTRSRDGVRTWSSNRWFPIIILAVMLLGSLLFAMLGTWSTWQMARQITSARETTGIVHSAEVVEERSHDSETGRTDTYYIPVVHYRYLVDGKEFRSDKVYPGTIDIRGP
jgi:hypothetical protein